jgi:hypothetical protein
MVGMPWGHDLSQDTISCVRESRILASGAFACPYAGPASDTPTRQFPDSLH